VYIIVIVHLNIIISIQAYIIVHLNIIISIQASMMQYYSFECDNVCQRVFSATHNYKRCT
jgi:hypothetical protein